MGISVVSLQEINVVSGVVIMAIWQRMSWHGPAVVARHV